MTLRDALTIYFKKHRSLRAVKHRIEGTNLEVSNQRPNKTTEDGRIKFKYELETIWLKLIHHQRPPIILAKLKENPDHSLTFIDMVCSDYEDLVLRNLNAIAEL